MVRGGNEIAVVDGPGALVVVDEPAGQVLAVEQRIAARLFQPQIVERGFAGRHGQRQAETAIAIDRRFADHAAVDDHRQRAAAAAKSGRVHASPLERRRPCAPARALFADRAPPRSRLPP